MNSIKGILNFVYKYKFCGLPNGVNIPPKFAAIFCIIKVNAICFFLPAASNTKYPNGKKVKSAISLAISILPIKVTYTKAKTHARKFLNLLTIFPTQVSNAFNNAKKKLEELKII